MKKLVSIFVIISCSTTTVDFFGKDTPVLISEGPPQVISNDFNHETRTFNFDYEKIVKKLAKIEYYDWYRIKHNKDDSIYIVIAKGRKRRYKAFSNMCRKYWIKEKNQKIDIFREEKCWN